jgi:hypothetical protein
METSMRQFFQRYLAAIEKQADALEQVGIGLAGIDHELGIANELAVTRGSPYEGLNEIANVLDGAVKALTKI